MPKLITPEMANETKLREYILEITHKRGISITDLSLACNVSRQAIYNFLYGRVSMGTNNLIRMLNSLGYKLAVVEMSEVEKLAFV